jgi:hypothetical protein
MTSTETRSFDVLAAAGRRMRLNFDPRERADSRLRWLGRLVLCSTLYHCGSPESEGLFGGEAGGSVPGSMAAEPDFTASRAAQPSIASGDGTTAPREAEAVPASSGPVNAASIPAAPTPAAPIPVEPPPTEGSDADGQDEPEASDPVDTPATPTGEPAAPSAPDAVSLIQIERARWDEEDEELEVRGVVSSPAVTLSVQFPDRAEPLLNENGSFRGEFSAVEDNPVQVIVTASDGARATARVEVD